MIIKCDECSRLFGNAKSLQQHKAAKHPREESIASRAIGAELDRAMGVPTDEEFDWL